VEVGKTIIKDSDEVIDEIRIVIVEGPSENHSSTNKPIGILLISGKQLNRDLLKGTEIDLSFEVSESRDITVSAYLNGTGQEFSQVFDGKKRDVQARLLASEILQLETKIQSEIDDATANNNQEIAQKLDKLLDQLQGLISESSTLSSDDVTDDRYKLEDKKRRLAQEVFQLTSSKRLDAAKAGYLEAKHSVSTLVKDSGNDREMHQVREIIAREQAFIHSTNPERIQAATGDLERIRFQILMRMPDFLVKMFEHLIEKRASMNDQIQAKQLIENGKHLIANASWDDLRQVNGRLWELMPDGERSSDDMRLYTNIV
jgi:molecular chaperone DnaK